MEELTPMQLRILTVLRGMGGWLTRARMVDQAGPKGYSQALGAPTRGEVRPGSLEQRGYVERRDENPAFEYRITAAGERALAAYEEANGQVPLIAPAAPPAD